MTAWAIPDCPKVFFDKLHAAGGYTAAFLPPFIVRINYRNHRKLCIIDGKVGYIGGFNVGDEYLGIVKRYGPWRDTHLRVVGDAIDQMQIRFIKDWNFTTRYGAVQLEQRYFPLREQTEGIRMQIVSSGPDTKWHNVHNGYFKMINEAEHHIYLTTPYFVPDDGIFEALNHRAGRQRRAGRRQPALLPELPSALSNKANTAQTGPQEVPAARFAVSE